jgi:hypothetical protein
MKEQELQALIELVTRQVLAQLSRETGQAEARDAGKTRLLVVGEAAEVPPQLCQGAVLCALEEYAAAQNILRYDKVVITALTLPQLADMAQGRPCDTAACAVTAALLNGREVLLLEKGLPHRAFAGKGSTGLYALLEGYVRTLQGFGVKLLTAERLYQPKVLPVRPAKYQAPAAQVPQGSAPPSSGRLITEARAHALLAQAADGAVSIPRDAILTPSAMDVFRAARVKVERDQN